MVAQFVSALAQRLHGPLHGGVAQAPGYRDTLAKPHDAGKPVENAEASIMRTGNEKAAIVRAKVKGRIERAAGAARVDRGMRPLVRRMGGLR